MKKELLFGGVVVALLVALVWYYIAQYHGL